MAFTAPRTWVAGEVVTASIGNTHWRDNLRYLKGLDGVPTIESGLIIDNTGGDEYLQIPSLTTAERGALTPVAGMLIYNETTTQFNKYENGAWRADLGFNSHHGDLSGLTDDDHTIYQKEDLLTTQGDLPYATAASTWTRLPKGTAGQSLRMNAGATAPEWAAPSPTMEFWVPPLYGSGGGGAPTGDYYRIRLIAGQTCNLTFRVPADFISLSSVKMLLIPITTGTFDWTVNTDFAADGEAYQLNSDSATADGQAGTNLTILELDISAAYTGLAANDNVGTTFTLDVLTTMTALDVLGLNVKYT